MTGYSERRDAARLAAIIVVGRLLLVALAAALGALLGWIAVPLVVLTLAAGIAASSRRLTNSGGTA